MLTDIVKPGNRIDIQTVEHAILGASSDAKVYSSKIYDILDDEKLEILMPMKGTKLILLPVDGEYQFCFYTAKGLYQCTVRIVERYKENSIYLLLCEMTSPIGKYQRREYYRLSCILPMRSRDLMEEEIKAIEKFDYQLIAGLPLTKGEIVDISGGGIRFVTSDRYEPGTQIVVYFNLNVHGKESTYELIGEVLSSKQNDVNKGIYEHRLKFTAIDNRKREEIIRYIFEEERKSRSSRGAESGR